jgi:alpha-L-fucosidase
MSRSFSRLALAFCLTAAPAALLAQGAASADPAREQRIQWWREARFGMFIHWGLYAVPAGEWKGKPIPGIGEWIMNRARIPVAEYEQLATQFNPVKFNADEWVALARNAGMKYLVITSKHHDGFAMYRSQVSKYNIVDATPFGRDPMKELAAACQKAGIRLCFYYSHAQDWHERDGAGNNWDFPPNDQKNFARYYEEKAKPQVRELLTQYGPIGLIWFDTPQLVTREQAVDIANLVHQLQPNCLVSGRVGHNVGDYDSAGDNQIAVGRIKRDWETPVTMNDTWGFKKDDHNWKPVPVLIKQLVRIASRGGNYLLNVGPTAEGLIPEPSVERLKAVGAWLKVNSEAINGTQPSPFPYNQDWGLITTRPGKMYLHVFDWPGSELTVYGIKNKVQKAYLLSDPSRKSLKVSQSAKPDLDMYATTFKLPVVAPERNDSVVVVEIGGAPDVVTSLTQQPSGAITLDAYLANINKGSPDSKVALTGSGAISNWTDTKDWLSWSVKAFRRGDYDLIAVTTQPGRGAAWEGGHDLLVKIGAAEYKVRANDDDRLVDPSNPHARYTVSRLGRVSIREPGSYTVELRPQTIQSSKGGGFSLAYLKLVPSK